MGPFWLVVNLEESDVEKKKKTWIQFCVDNLLFLCHVLYLLSSVMK